MKPSTLAIAALACVNAALVGYIVLRAPAAPVPAPPAISTRLTAAAAHAPAHSADLRALAATIKAADHATVRDVLRAAGLPDDTVRSIVQALIWKEHAARHKELMPPANAPAKWWRSPYDSHSWDSLTKEQRERIHALQAATEDEERRLLGPDPDNDPASLLAFLSPEKRSRIQRIEDDYRELRDEVQRGIGGFLLPSDTEKLRLLDIEQERDIRAVMTPEEEEAYDLRMSPTAVNLRSELSSYNVTEAEFRQIYALQKAFDDKYRLHDPFESREGRPAAYWDERAREDRQIWEQIRKLIGPERYNLAQRNQDADYRILKEAAVRFDLPADMPARVYSLRHDVASGVGQLLANSSLSPVARKQALVELANRTREQVTQNLGPEIAAVYLENNMRWLKELEQGNAVTFSAEGNGWDTVRLDEAAEPRFE